MFIRQAIYSFNNNNVIVKVPFDIERETEKCYYTEHARFLKSEIGIPMLKSTTQYPYVEVVMVDATEEMLRNKLGEWFTERAVKIWGKDI